MGQFTAEYLAATREGMWADSREALAPLALETRDRILDVGAGTGALTRVLREECSGQVVALDADPSLLGAVAPPRVLGDAGRLPFRDRTVSLVVCQALLVNVPDPEALVAEFARVTTDAVAAIEPDNSEVTLESTVPAEPYLARRARSWYLDGVQTDATLGATRDVFEAAGLAVESVTRYEHVRTVEPPYSERAIEAARRKASGDGLADDRATVLAGGASPAEFDDLRQAWREMGRDAIEQMQAGEYRYEETIPFYVTVGRRPE